LLDNLASDCGSAPNIMNFSAEILNSLGFGVVIISAENHQIVYSNSKLLSMSGHAREDILGKQCHDLLCPAEKGACPISDLGQPIDNSERFLICADGKRLPVLKTAVPLNIGGSQFFMESIIDNSLQKDIRDMLSNTNENLKTEIEKHAKAQDKLKHLAYHDYLTILPNRLLFVEELNHAIFLAQRSSKMLAVLFLDLDGFKMINDTMGHVTGDQLLLAISKRLTDTVRKSDIVARIGGDEFIVMIEHVENVDGVKAFMDKILASFNKPFTIKEQELFVTTSLGAAIYPADGDNADVLIQNADIAMYKAKELGRNQGLLCTPDMQKSVSEYMKLSHQLYRALDRNELELYYQPQIECTSHKIIGVEALARWNHPTLGLIYPKKFIPIAEKTGLIHSIGEWVIRTACNQNKAWQNAGLPKIPVAVNLSVLQFNNPNLAQRTETILRETGLSPEYLDLEITESIIMREIIAVVDTLNELKQMGISISIDDFGTEYSSLQYLKQLPVDKIKIAMPFVQGAETNLKDQAITKSILVLAEKMGLRVIAEGVETQKQLSFLTQSHCTEAQGYFFSRPLPVQEVEEILRKGVACSLDEKT